MGVRSRILLALTILVTAASGIGAIFWEQELRYVQPTPVPETYAPIPLGSNVALDRSLTTASKPTLFHFYNPECPCSRFNLKHFKSLARKYATEIAFVAVVPPPEKDATDYVTNLSSRLGQGVSVVIDTDGDIAGKLGVYSTPQAALLDASNKLAYRGNYNRTRYCTNPTTDYARIAIEALLHDRTIPDFGPEAFVAYGCEINRPQTFPLSPNLHGNTTAKLD
ncbi:MAG: AhpC/TSA family protein [Salibacteraceae bacterium]